MKQAAVAAALLLGCATHATHGDGGPFDADEPPYTGPFIATVGAHPANNVCALVHVESQGADSVVVTSGPTSAYGVTTPSLPLTGGRGTVAVCALDASSTTHFQATTFANGATSAMSADLTFTTGPMPDGLPPFTVTGTSTSPYVGVGFSWGPDSAWLPSISMILDSSGRIVWYQQAVSPDSCFFLETPSPGRFQLWNGPPQYVYDSGSTNNAQFVEQDIAGNVYQSWIDPYPGFIASGMDALVLAGGGAAVLGYDLLSNVSITYGGQIYTGQSVLDQSLDVVDSAGNVQLHWETWPSMQPSVLDQWSPGQEFNLHFNSVDQFPDGTFLVSVHEDGSLLKIGPSSSDAKQGTVVWTLGGLGSNFKFVNDPENGFGTQHDARILPDGDILMMDNGGYSGLSGTGKPASRGVEYQLDDSTATATLVWSFSEPHGKSSKSMGSARRLANGNTLLGFGILGEAYEVDPAGNVVFSIVAPDFQGSPVFVFRAVPIATLY